jgi:hypothetical protein
MSNRSHDVFPNQAGRRHQQRDTASSAPPPTRRTNPADMYYSDLHAHLNALISSRLPLALPPHVANPDVYLTGLLPFADVYIAFEEAWDAVCGPDESDGANDGDPAPDAAASSADDVWVDVPLDASGVRATHASRTTGGRGAAAAGSPTPPPLPPRPAAAKAPRQPSVETDDDDEYDAGCLVAALRTLRPPGMPRAARLRADIATLARLPDSDAAVDALLAARRPEPVRRLVEERLERIVARPGGGGEGGEGAAEVGPHLLLAYACVLYPAVFAGGRWLRSVLAAPGLDFWTRRRPGPRGEHRLAPSTAGSMSASGSRPPADVFDTGVHEKPRSFTGGQQAALERAGLSFWFFAPGGDERGEFARRLGALDGDAEDGDCGALGDRRRAEVVAEARAVLECCEQLVEALDESVGRGGDAVVVERLEKEGEEEEEEARPHRRIEAAAGAVGQAWRRGREAVGQAWRNAGGYAGVALAVGCASASLYAMYRSGYWSA